MAGTTDIDVKAAAAVQQRNATSAESSNEPI
jgi:hypothetical protein